MSQENVERMRASYDRAASGDFSALLDGFTADTEFVTSPEVPDAGTYRGEAAVRWIEQWIASFDDLMIEATEIRDSGDKVFIGIVQRGRPSGGASQVEGRWWQVATFREGELVRSELFPDRAQALEAAGLSE
jgi:ketosteroid isomerase-like protein